MCSLPGGSLSCIESHGFSRTLPTVNAKNSTYERRKWIIENDGLKKPLEHAGMTQNE